MNIEWVVVGFPVRPVLPGWQVEGDVQKIGLCHEDVHSYFETTKALKMSHSLFLALSVLGPDKWSTARPSSLYKPS